MKKTIAKLLTAVGILFAGAASLGCIIIIADEPKAPKSLID